MARSKYWCITVNSGEFLHENAWEEEWKSDRWSFMIAQPEVVAHLHVQAYVEYDGAQGCRFGFVRAHFPGAHIEQRRGTGAEAAAYCRKDDSWVGSWRFERGDMAVVAQGKRTDLELIRDLVKANMSWVQIVEQVPGGLRYSREIRAYAQALEEEKEIPDQGLALRGWQTELYGLLTGPSVRRRIFWIWSHHSAVGKTTTLQYFAERHRLSTLPATMNLTNIMHAYDGRTHKVIWFDLSRSDPIDATATDILEKLSNGGFIFSGKYDSCVKRCDAHIVVTCNRPPPHERLPERIVEYRINNMGERVVDIALPNDVNGWLNPDFILE